AARSVGLLVGQLITTQGPRREERERDSGDQGDDVLVVGEGVPEERPMPTDARCTRAVAAVIPISTSRARYLAAKVMAMSWLLSPSSATKITAVESRNAYIG